MQEPAEEQLTLYEIKAMMTWQKMHAHQFIGEDAQRFCDQVEGWWVLHPSVNHMHGYPVTLVSNTAGCFVMNFQTEKIKNYSNV